MANKGMMTGMRGVYLVAAELANRGFIVSPTSRSALGADLLVTDQRCRRAWSVQVKTNGKPAGFWLLSKRAKEIKSNAHIYVFVNLRNGEARPDFYVVPSRVVARKAHTYKAKKTKSVWYEFRREPRDPEVAKYKERWAAFGRPN